MCFWIEKPGCGQNDQEFNGLARVIRILSTSIVKQQNGLEKNQIYRIRDKQDSWRVGQDEISKIVTNYYQKLFTSTDLDPPSIVLEHVPQVITEEMNQTLTYEFREEEVIVALKQMAPMKAPGPDGTNER